MADPKRPGHPPDPAHGRNPPPPPPEPAYGGYPPPPYGGYPPAPAYGGYPPPPYGGYPPMPAYGGYPPPPYGSVYPPAPLYGGGYPPPPAYAYGGYPPAHAYGEIDYYDISLVDGFNLPVIVKAFNGTGNCSTAGCDGDLRQNCPSDLTLKAKGKVIACRSACDVYKTDEYCCRGKYGNPDTCLPSNYSKSFKQVCPAAYSYAYDDPTSLITCSGANYVVAFCASRNQTVCSYHDNQLFCNQSKGLKVVPHRWWVAVLAIPLMLKL